MSQSNYLENLLQKFGMADCKTRSTPCEQNPSVFIKSDEIPEESSRKYREIYATTCTRPDLTCLGWSTAHLYYTALYVTLIGRC